jgi:hypothetical protein
LQLKLLLFQCSNKGLNQGDALLSLFWATHEKFLVTMLLEFLRFLTKCAANTFTELQINSGLARVEIGEAFSAQVFYLREEFLELSCATGEIVNHGDFGTRSELL